MPLDFQFNMILSMSLSYMVKRIATLEICSRSRASGQLQVVQVANLTRTEFTKLDFNIVYLRGVETNLL